MRIDRSKADAFLFSKVDARAAAWLRLAFAAVIPFFFASRNIGPPSWAGDQIARIYESFFLTAGFDLLVAFLCVLLAFGWHSRATAFVLVVLLAPLDFVDIARQSRHVMLSALLSFSFVQSDVIRFPWTSKAAVIDSAGPAWPIRLIQLQLTVLYGVNAIAKSNPNYLSGDALMDMSLELENFRQVLSANVIHFGMLSVPIAAAAVASALMEYFLASAFWVKPLRWVVAISGIAFHFVLTRIVHIFMLDYATIFLYLAFLLPLVTRARSAPDRSSPQLSARRQDPPILPEA
ncbi:MAG: HTTM domain-containing protein [Gemmatimonadales bacterium]